MFSIRQALRLGACVARTRHAVCCYAPIIREPNSIEVLRHVRLTHEDGGNRREFGKLEGKMRLSFTCKKCKTRTTNKLISKLAYNKGVVIVRCDGCNNNHLIADNLGWFSEVNGMNIEKLMALKGETVRKVMNDVDGYYEAVLKEELKLQSKKDASEIKDDECPDEIKMIEESKGS